MYGRRNFSAAAKPGALLLALLAGSGSTADEGRVLDRVVAVVRPGAADANTARAKEDQRVLRLITLSELEFEVSVALIQHGALDAATKVLDEETLRTGLDYAIGQFLEAEEADKLHAFPIEAAELSKEEDQFRAKFPSNAAVDSFLRRFDMDPRQLEAVLERQLRAQRFLESKLRLRAQVSEAELKRYYGDHSSELGQPFEVIREPLLAKLKLERYQTLAKNEVDQLKRAADVRIVVGQSMREAAP